VNKYDLLGTGLSLDEILVPACVMSPFFVISAISPVATVLRWLSLCVGACLEKCNTLNIFKKLFDILHRCF